jgi:hypothetical protein
MLPKMTSALSAWQQRFSFEVVRKSVIDFEVKEIKSRIDFAGVITPLSARQLEIKPEGQRAWRWFEVHTSAAIEIKPDDIVTFKCKKYRVMAQHDFSDYGYWRYEIAEAFTE